MNPEGLTTPEFFIQGQDGKSYFRGQPHVLFTFALTEFANGKLVWFCRHNRCQKRQVGKTFRRYRRNNSNFLSRRKSLHVRFSKIIFHSHDILPFRNFYKDTGSYSARKSMSLRPTGRSLNL